MDVNSNAVKPSKPLRPWRETLKDDSCKVKANKLIHPKGRSHPQTRHAVTALASLDGADGHHGLEHHEADLRVHVGPVGLDLAERRLRQMQPTELVGCGRR